MRGRIRVGLSSWTDKSLLDSKKFYPPRTNDAERTLRFYTEQLPDLVEVNSTYYSLPSERNATLWVERAPDDFRFDVRPSPGFVDRQLSDLGDAHCRRRIVEFVDMVVSCASRG